MVVLAKAPNPVETPYAGSPWASRSTISRDSAILCSAASLNSTRSTAAGDRDDLGDCDSNSVEFDGHREGISGEVRAERYLQCDISNGFGSGVQAFTGEPISRP